MVTEALSNKKEEKKIKKQKEVEDRFQHIKVTAGWKSGNKDERNL